MKHGKLILALMLVLAVLMPVQVFAQKAIVLRLAETHPKGYPTEMGDEEFARLVKERSGGRIVIEVYPGSQLGQEKAVIEQVQFGAIDITRVSVSPLASFVPKLNAFQMPYLYRDEAHMWKVLNGDRKGFSLASSPSASSASLVRGRIAQLIHLQRQVKTPADLKVLKIACGESELLMVSVSAFGRPDPMPYGEVYPPCRPASSTARRTTGPPFSRPALRGRHVLHADEHTRFPRSSSLKVPLAGSRRRSGLIQQAAADAVAFHAPIGRSTSSFDDKVMARRSVHRRTRQGPGSH